MASKDSYSQTKVFEAFGRTPLPGGNGVALGVDTFGCESFLVFVMPQRTGAGSFSGSGVIGFEDNNVSTSPSAPWETVEPEFIIGNPIAETFDNLADTKKLGYIGKKRFVRATIQTAGGSVMWIGGSYVLKMPLNAPTGVQP